MAQKKGGTIFQLLGPGLITGASDDDPSGIGTYSQAGAKFGFSMLWALLLTWPLMSAVQEISARIGRTTGRGIAGNLRKHYHPFFGRPVVIALFLANVINIGADLGAMGASLQMLIGGSALVYDVMFALICFLGIAVFSYKKYSLILKWSSISLFAYIAVPFAVEVPWADAIKSTFMPTLSSDGYLTMLVAVLGTTISPYLFFWQSSEEAEEVHLTKGDKPLAKAPEQAATNFRRIRIDTYVGMLFSNVVAWFIMLTAAVTLFKEGERSAIESAQQAARALEPLGGQAAFILFAIGIIGTGLLAVPVLAGSAAYAVSEEMRWRVGIEYSPKRAPYFYGILGLATLIGLAINFTSINPIKALVWSAAINGVVAVPVMVAMMLMVRNPKVMGPIAPRGRFLYVIGWAATLIMGAAALAMIVRWFI